MALDVGSVYARAGFHYDDDGADRFERRLRDLRGATRAPVQAHGRMDVDRRGFEEYDRRISSTRSKSKRPIETHAGVNVDNRGFARYEERLAAARGHATRFGTTVSAAGLGARASLLGVQGGAVAAGAALAGVVFSGARFEQKMNGVRAVTQASKKEMKALSDAAIDLGTKYGIGAAKAADAITELAKGGLSTSTILGGALKGALSLAAAGGLELADAAATTVNALNLFHLEGSKATHVADAFATAANATTADVEFFAQGLAQGGLAAKSAGLTFDQTTLALEAMAKSGFKSGSDAGTSLKTMLVQLAAPTKQSAALAEQLGLKFFDTHGQMKSLVDISAMLRDKFGGLTKEQRLHYASTLVGQDGMRGLLALFNAGPKNMEKWGAGLKTTGSAARTARIQNEGLAGAGRKLLASLEGLGIRLSKYLNPALETAARAVAGFIGRLSKGEKAGGGLGRTIKDLHSILRTVGPALGVVGKVIGTTFSVIVSTARKAIGGIRQVFSGVASIFKGVAKVISSIVHGDIKGALNGLGRIISGTVRAAIGVMRVLTAPFRAAFGAIFKGLAGVARSSFSAVSSVVRTVLRFLTGAASTLLGILSDVAHAAAGLPIVGGAFKGIARTIDDAKDSIDRYRESLKKTNKEHRTTQRDVSNARDDVEKWRKRVAASKKGTDEHRRALAGLNRSHRTYLRTLLDTQPPAKRSAKNIGWIGKAAHGAAGAVGDAGDSIAQNLNQLAKDLVGKNAVRFRAVVPTLLGIISPFARGGFTARAAGGYMIGEPGERGTDTVPLMVDPRGAIATRHQQAALGIMGAPVRGSSARGPGGGVPLVGVVAGRGERYIGPDEVPAMDELARARGFGGGLAELFATVDQPHYMARGGFVPAARGMVHVPGDPNSTGGRDRVNASIVQAVSQWIRRYHADIGYAYDPGGGHKSPGHNVTGTATDVYPGPGGNWDLLERGLRVLVKRGLTVYYGTHGIGTPLEGHGRGNHAHIEWGSHPGAGFGDVSLGRPKIIGPPGALRTIAQAAADRMRKTGNSYLDKIASAMGGGDIPTAGSSASARANMAYARSIMERFGWGPGQWPSWRELGMQESGWITDRTNPSSGAFGVGQFLGGTKSAYAKYGATARGNGRAQVNAMAHYIKKRYGSPAAAMAHERAYNWYARGGFVRAALGKQPQRGPYTFARPGYENPYLGIPEPTPSRPYTGLHGHPQRQRGKAIMDRLWNVAAPFYGQKPGASLPRTRFDADSLFVAYLENVGAKPGSGYIDFPDWVNYGEDYTERGKKIHAPGLLDGPKKGAQMFALLFHEWAHYFQRFDTKRRDGVNFAEGGAELFSRLRGPEIMRRAGYGSWKNPAATYRREMGAMGKALGRWWKPWVLSEQFKPTLLEKWARARRAPGFVGTGKVPLAVDDRLGGFSPRARGGFLRAATGMAPGATYSPLWPTGSGKIEVPGVYGASPREVAQRNATIDYAKYDPLGANPEALRKQALSVGGKYGQDLKDVTDLNTKYGRLERRYNTTEEVLVDETTGKVNRAAVNKRAGELRVLRDIRVKIMAKLRAARAHAIAVIRLFKRMRHRAYGIIRTIRDAKGPGAPKLRKRMRDLITGYNKKIKEWRGRLTTLGGTIYDADTDRIEAQGALDEVLGTKATPQDAPDPTDAGDGTGTPSPLDVATAALAQVTAYNQGTTDLFSTFGNNFVAAGTAGAGLATGLERAAGVRYYGAGTPLADRGPAGTVGAGMGGVVQHITFTGPQPTEPHPWVQASMHEATAALAGQAGGLG